MNSNENIFIEAILKNKIAKIKILLENKANIDIQDKEGKTALIYACIHNKIDIVKILKSYDVDITLKDINGRTASNHAAMYKLLNESHYCSLF